MTRRSTPDSDIGSCLLSDESFRLVWVRLGNIGNVLDDSPGIQAVDCLIKEAGRTQIVSYFPNTRHIFKEKKTFFYTIDEPFSSNISFFPNI